MGAICAKMAHNCAKPGCVILSSRVEFAARKTDIHRGPRTYYSWDILDRDPRFEVNWILCAGYLTRLYVDCGLIIIFVDIHRLALSEALRTSVVSIRNEAKLRDAGAMNEAYTNQGQAIYVLSVVQYECNQRRGTLRGTHLAEH